MGKPTGFLDYERNNTREISPLDRIKNFNDFHLPLSREEQQIQASRCMNCGVPFCQSGLQIKGASVGCPLGNLIPEWNDLIYHGLWEKAFDRLMKTTSFPEFTGRVCPALCEVGCTCNVNGDPVTVKANELSIIEMAFEKGWMKPNKNIKRNGKTVAIVGSGPSGLACANELNNMGYTVTLFEKSDRIGGLLMYGIPNMKIEKHIIDRRVNLMKESGITFKTNSYIITKEQADELKNNFDYVVLSTGASQPRNLNIPGRELENVMFAVDYLSKNTKTLLDTGSADTLAKDKNVLVIGGGDTGNDCIGTAVRQGAKSIIQFEIMPKKPEKRQANNPWPEWPNVLKTDYGTTEAITKYNKDPRIFEITAKQFIGDKKVQAVKAVNVKWEKVNGRMTPVEIKDSEKAFNVDLVLLAMGFLGTNPKLAEAFNIELDARTNIITKNYQTSDSKVFACGDSRRGQSLVVWGVREGRECAAAIDALNK